MGGRDRHETHRVATPLELLFDLTFVVAFGLAASQFAHAIAENHIATGLLGFVFGSFGICWAWTNFSWFASAYDTDDWIFRVVTMVQMIGVLVFALGLPRVFASLEQGGRLETAVIVFGYVIMRIALVFQWLRAAKQDPPRRRVCLTYASLISISQIGWVVLIFLPLSIPVHIGIITVLCAAEMAIPMIAEKKDGGTPWHAHHIAERHGLFAIIALGEGVVGTVAALSAVVEQYGWSIDAALVGIAGIGVTFGLWWVYYMLPSGPILERHPDRAPTWGYSQLFIIASIVATGAGLHVAAYFIEDKAHISALSTVLAVAIPVSIFLGMVYWLYYYLVKRFDPFHWWLLLGTAIVVAATIVAAASGVSMAACLVILTFAPVVTVAGYEARGYRHQADSLSS